MENNKDENMLKGIQHQFVRQLINRRKELGLTQKEVAEAAGLPQSQIGRIESELLSPRLNTILKVCEVLKITLSCQPKQDSH